MINLNKHFMTNIQFHFGVFLWGSCGNKSHTTVSFKRTPKAQWVRSQKTPNSFACLFVIKIIHSRKKIGRKNSSMSQWENMINIFTMTLVHSMAETRYTNKLTLKWLNKNSTIVAKMGIFVPCAYKAIYVQVNI